MSSGGRRFRRAYAVYQAMVKTGNGCNVTQNITVAKQQRSTLESILDTLKTPAGKLAAGIAGGQNYEKATQNTRNLAQQIQEGLETIMTEENYESISNLLTQKISDGLKNIDTSSFEALGTSLGDLAEEQIKKVFSLPFFNRYSIKN